MGLIELNGITKRFGQTIAVDRLTLHIEAGEFLTLLGPSGCGKTTVLRMIAGLENPDEGVLCIRGEKVFSAPEGFYVPPGKRGVGLVFQSYALWPHMSVFENVAFGLQVQGVERRDMEEEVKASLEYMRLGGMEKRYPAELSGGQQQRVALARMLATRPSVFLMDEPLSNLDAKLRMEMRAEIKRLHRETQATTIYVTHDQNEALTMSTRVAVMNQGVLEQLASPTEIYKRPANLFVADFIGSPTMNFIPGRIVRQDGGVYFRNDVILPLALSSSLEALAAKEVTAAIRPEDIRTSAMGDPLGTGWEVYSVLPAGADVILQVKRGSLLLTVRETGETIPDIGERIDLRYSPDAILFYDRDTGNLLHPPPPHP